MLEKQEVSNKKQKMRHVVALATKVFVPCRPSFDKIEYDFIYF
jgi:hypothetical protein